MQVRGMKRRSHVAIVLGMVVVTLEIALASGNVRARV